MEIAETIKTTHEILIIHFKDVNNKVHEKYIDINKTEKGEILSISIGNKEITVFDLEIMDFLKRKGKL